MVTGTEMALLNKIEFLHICYRGNVLCFTKLYFGSLFYNEKIISLYENKFIHSNIYERSKSLEKDLWSQQNSFKYIHERRKSRLLRKHLLNEEFNRIPFIQVGTIVKKMDKTTKKLTSHIFRFKSCYINCTASLSILLSNTR